MDRFEDLDEYDPDAVESWAREHWDDVDAYERAQNPDGEPYFFVDGPPYTSGGAHMGTTWNKALKDAYIRHLRMRGHAVTDRPGYDMHGLPIETKVEEELGFENKRDIEDYGEEAFIEACKEFAEDNLDRLQSDFRSFGVWMDWDDPYRTVDPTYMEAAWWAFQRVHERGLVERGKRSISQCPRCETAIANNEVEYHEVGDPSIYVKFPLRGGERGEPPSGASGDAPGREGSLVIWTTTPWTIPANTFVAVDPDLTYQAVRAYGGGSSGESEVLWIAEPCVEDVLKRGRYSDYEVVDEATGEELVGWEYEHPLADRVPDHPDGDGALQVYGADYVEADRTGLVHSAPGHGEVDFERGRELGLEVFCPVGTDGVYTDEAGAYAGTFVRDANGRIVGDLDDDGLLLHEGTHEHDYGQCWRCDTDVIQIVTDQWFITVTDVKDELLDHVGDAEWYPDWARDNRFHDFVADAPDWNVSRQRYWGIPIPIWTPEGAAPEEEADDMIVIGTRDELAERADQDVDPETIDLHKPTVDDLTITEGGTTYTRTPDVFDVWLDSSVATWGTLDFPEEREAHDGLWPADLIVEAHDQTRGWFWSQLGMGTAAVDECPYERVLMHGHALDEDGRKMSKSVGNVIEPDAVIDRFGADPMRVFLLSADPQGDDMRFSWDEVENAARDLNVLWNVARFPQPYMALDGVDPADLSVDAVRGHLEPIDRWVLSRLQSTVGAATEAFEAFQQDDAIEAIREFVVEDVSRYYVQSVRDRMWVEEDDPSKTAAYATLTRVVETTARLLAPFAPFLAEAIDRGVGAADRETVHAADWPAVDDALHDPDLETEIETVRAVEEAGAHARQRAGRKRRWPIRRLVVDVAGDVDDPASVAAAVREHEALLADRLNAREVVVVPPDETWDELRHSAEADMSALGPAFGDDAHAVMEACNAARIDAPTVDELESAVADAIGETVVLDPGMVEFVPEPPANTAGAGFDGGRVYVDATLTDAIEAEGYAREVIRRVQEARKELGLDVNDRIVLGLDVDDERVADLIADREPLIAREVRADRIGAVDADHEETHEIEGVTVRIAVVPVSGVTA